MKLGFEKIKEISTGAVRVEQHDGYINFYRFTKSQEEFYKAYDEVFYKKTFATAGVRLSFKTDSEILTLKGAISTVFASTRRYYSFDITVNGRHIGSVDNYGDTVFEGNYAKIELPLDDFDKTFNLGAGQKTVEVYFPYTVKVDLNEVSVSDGAAVEPLPKKEKLLSFGDSITQGYDSLRIIHHYTAQLANALGLELVNKGIGGEVFQPKLAACREDFTPKYITVAYGINDWTRRTREEFRENCRGFYKTVSENYPNTPIFGITPVWVKNAERQTAFGSYSDLEKEIINCTADLKNVTVIPGVDFILHDEKYFGDLNVHPSNEGFDQYFNSLYTEIKKYI